jgi:hypothetical protein
MAKSWKSLSSAASGLDELDDGYTSAEERQQALTVARARAWQAVVSVYAVQPDDPYLAWRYLHDHPVFAGDEICSSYFSLVLDIHYTRVDPATGAVEADPVRNTQTKVWLEAGPTWLRSEDPDGERWETAADHETVYWNVHDHKLDSSGLTFEAAMIELARRVRQHYGDDRSKVYSSTECPPA